MVSKQGFKTRAETNEAKFKRDLYLTRFKKKSHETMSKRLNVRKMGVASPARKHLTPMRRDTVRNPQTLTAGEAVEKREPSSSEVGSVDW